MTQESAIAGSTPERAPAEGVPSLVPVRMLNEFAYCPRLSYLEWSQGEWTDNADTLDGKHVHRRVDVGETGRPRLHERSVKLSSEALGIIAVIDLVESDGGGARPVEYKRGNKPPVAEGAWEPERVQLCAQGLLLREHGYRSNEGVIYFAASRERVRIRFTDELVGRTLELLAQMRTILGRGELPLPLEDSPKCPRCSLVTICLPDETNCLRGGEPPRPIAASDPGTFPLVVQDPGSVIRLKGECLLVEPHEGESSLVRLEQTSHVVAVGRVQCTSAMLKECCDRGIPIVHMSGSWLTGITSGLIHKNVELRAEQFAAARDSVRSLELARALVSAKVWNGRVLLRRNGKPDERALVMLKQLCNLAWEVPDAEGLLGIEGSAARVYFGGFSTMLRGAGAAFSIDERNRRPPKDPVNALLSFAYTLLAKDWLIALSTVGFDPLMGLYHKPKYGKPALALDMMEPFRPVIADSTVVTALNNGEVGPDDFIERMGGVLLKPEGRQRFIATYERRIATEIAHPVFGYKCSYRRIFEIEARLLGRWLTGEIERYLPFQIR
ncbi:MAG: CRISPR-associated endonuclease Cas1 [Thermoanaerobaculia bacterium]|nr:CRISPR-associated endonuclease Cas1 [Thermoanaerobaculia bacterium]